MSHPIISLLVPFHGDNGERERVWNWLQNYWRGQIPGVEIVIGRDRKSERRFRNKPFSKTAAVNDAFRRSHGDVVVILDADAYLPGLVLIHCADRIRTAVAHDAKLWFVPYRHIFRLTKSATALVIQSDPLNPLTFPSPPPPSVIEDSSGSAFGHKYGALCQIMPREAFEAVCGMDCRFRGWGGEDVSFLRALDTLYAKHKNMPNDILHLWHPKLAAGEWMDPKGAFWETRIWAGQDQSRVNDRLTLEYVKATGHPGKMRKLVKAGCRACGHWRSCRKCS